MSFPPPALPPRRPPVRRRVKPARGAKVASLAMSAASTLGLVALFAKQDETSSTLVATPSPGATGSTTSSATSIADGVFVGVADSNRWGTVQVQIVVSDGLLTDVQVLSSPDSDRKSVRINERALPTLTAEALTVQTANIDSVSGATYTSRSYAISLQSALDAASAAA